MKTKLLFSIILILTVKIFAQLESIKKFPKAYDSQEIKELTPVWISENEILAFYSISTLDTIYSRRTTNRGQTWSSQKFERMINPIFPLSELFSLSTLKGDNGRIFLAWSDTSVKIIYSDDKGLSWNYSTGLHSPLLTPRFLNFTKLQNGKILLTYRASNWNFITSEDNGETWLPEIEISLPAPTFLLYSLSLVSIGEDSLLCTVSKGLMGSVYSIYSTDGGASWTDTVRIFNTNYSFHFGPRLKLAEDTNSNLYLVFENNRKTEFEEYNQQDVSILMSNDKGISWQEMNSFTNYLGDDAFKDLTTLEDKIFVTFQSPRISEIEEYYYGIMDESDDILTPPVLLNAEVMEVDYESNEFIYNALIVDDNAVSQVNVELEDGAFFGEMFDDGMHNDSLANDNIFGNTFPILTPTLVAPYYGNRYSMDVNKIQLPLNNKGILADVIYTHLGLLAKVLMYDVNNNLRIDTVTANIPVQNPGSGGQYDGGHFLFSGGFCLSGYNGDSLWSNAVASAMLVEDYLPGKVGGDPDDPVNRLYVINKDDIPFSYTWQNWKDAVSLGAEFYDGDKDGIYNPIDKNWNGTWDTNEDMPALLGDETIFCVYNDGVPYNMRRWNTVDPQGIEIRQTVFGSDNPELENVIFIRYSILNTGSVAEVLDSVYFGIWEDGDLGDHTDDVVGCDTLLNSGFYYNATSDWQYGENCPAFFTTLLQGPLIQTNEISDTAVVNYGNHISTTRNPGSKNLNLSSHIFLIGGDPWLNDPSNKFEARNFLEGKNRIGEFPAPCNFPYCEVRGGVNCNEVDPHFWASGDPVNDIGWINGMNLDHKNLVSTGPFKLEKDKPQEIIIAYVLGRGTDYFNSITVARENVVRVIQEYESNFASMTYSSPPPTNPVSSYVLYQNYPNPFNPTTTIRYELPQDGIVTIDIYDILGQRVRTILNEFQKVDRYEVHFNASGLASGVYIYRMTVNDFIESKKMMLIK